MCVCVRACVGRASEASRVPKRGRFAPPLPPRASRPRRACGSAHDRTKASARSMSSRKKEAGCRGLGHMGQGEVESCKL
eukprot:6180000-Pleurochrysis_carterae.AAC.1